MERPNGHLGDGQPVSQVGLADGDVITLGATQIKFHEKLGAAPRRKARDDRPERGAGPGAAG